MEAKALRARGWTISAIARHLQINRRTVRNYLTDQVTPGKRRAVGPDVFDPFTDYARQRLADDPHLWASALHDELLELGYSGSYSSLTRALQLPDPPTSWGWGKTAHLLVGALAHSSRWRGGGVGPGRGPTAPD